MLHLAQVQKKGFLGKTGLRLLARQKSEDTWGAIATEEVILYAESHSFGEGVLILVDISPNRQILSIQDATHWVLEFVQQYLAKGITPSFLQQETERVEQWRQSLTLQSQDLARRTIELEARREQIQQLEEQLKREKKKLESLAANIQAKTNPSP